MSQTTTLTRYYSTRKRNVVSKTSQNILREDDKVKIAAEKRDENVKTTSVPNAVKGNVKCQGSEGSKDVSRKKKPAPVKKERKLPTATEKKSKGKQGTLKKFFTSESDKVKSEENTKAKNCFPCAGQKRVSSPFMVEPGCHSLLQSPNRKLSSPSDEGTPPKRKHLEKRVAALKKESRNIDAPKDTSSRKLQLDSLSNKSSTVVHFPKSKLVPAKKNPIRTPDKSDVVIDQSRPKLIKSSKLDELKGALQLFKEKNSKLKELQSNPYMINCIASSSKSLDKRKPLPAVFACERFHYLVQSDPLVLPFKYMVLSEMFCSLDSLVGTLHNKKEKIIFNNVKEVVKDIVKRNFTEEHLGQISTVLPSAYNLSWEKTNSTEYQLIITPNISAESKKKSAAFQPMDSSCLISRFEMFNKNLLELVKHYHMGFLTRIHFAKVDKNNIKRWHPKFPVDSVPDIAVAQLHESPELKAFAAKDVLNKFRGSIRKKVAKASQSGAEEIENSGSRHKPVTSKELKDMHVNILDRICGEKSAKLLKTSAGRDPSPLGMGKLAMLEQVPKIVNILFHYVIKERRAAVPVDTIVDKLIYSVDLLSTPGEVKYHLKLIGEKFPFWLNFIQIPKGVYITINKLTNINEMLDNAGLH